MILPILAAATVAGLGPRPVELTGPDPQIYAAKLAGFADQLAAQAQGQACADTTDTSVSGLALDPAALGRQGVNMTGVSGGVWSERVDVAGCGRRTQAHLMMARRGDGWGVLPLPPGASLVSYRLARDTLTLALAAAIAERPRLTCSPDEQKRSLRLADTAVITPPVSRQPWTERWSFSICDQPRPVDVVFTPTPDGGTSMSIQAR